MAINGLYGFFRPLVQCTICNAQQHSVAVLDINEAAIFTTTTTK
ncbi:hypothetical protein TYRP_008216 [Tyrophagus putrescentiae]|nr:hypothetical protein TYRP_008216 [Tyrophagus putrescentiae]